MAPPFVHSGMVIYYCMILLSEWSFLAQVNSLHLIEQQAKQEIGLYHTTLYRVSIELNN